MQTKTTSKDIAGYPNNPTIRKCFNDKSFMEEKAYDKMKEHVLHKSHLDNATDWIVMYRDGPFMHEGEWLMYSPSLNRLRKDTISEYYKMKSNIGYGH